MNIAPRPTRGGGFTLLELLVVVAILMLLTGAAVFSFPNLLRGSELEEGARQFAAALRYARAEAANTGRTVRIGFEHHRQWEELVGDAAMRGGRTSDVHDDHGMYRARVTWEADPVRRPGVFEPLLGRAWVEALPDELVVVTAVRPQGPDAAAMRHFLERARAAGEDEAAVLPRISFHPDGSSDSVEIELHGRDARDDRRAIVRVDGLTGTVRHELVYGDRQRDEPDDQAEPVDEPEIEVEQRLREGLEDREQRMDEARVGEDWQWDWNDNER